MDKNLNAMQQRKALQAYNIAWLEGPHLDERYTIVGSAESFVLETGLLCVFDLVPNVQNLPRFRGRWDEKADALDVDILNVDEGVKRLFTAGTPQYEGHHRQRMPGSQRKFEVSITVPGIIVCKGVISLNLKRGMSVGGDIGLSGQVSNSPLNNETGL